MSTSRGRLKIYLGFAAGVGKTYRLLQEAQALKQRGSDVVIGAIDPRGRQESVALMSELELSPRRTFSYQGVLIDEMDIEALLARRPQAVIVDDVAHTNVPGSKHAKRYQDVTALLDAGIEVLCAFNIANLESLNDVVARAAALRVRDTIPDRFIAQAAEVVAIDLDVDSLLDRLHAGKILPLEQVEAALAKSFQRKHLAMLRELLLREVAERLEQRSASDVAGVAPEKSWGGKLMVCLSSNPPHGRTLLRRGSRLSGRLRTDWYVVYVETVKEAPHRIDEAARTQLLANIELAKELGAEFVRLRGEDAEESLLSFARSHGVSDLVIGRGRDSFLHKLMRRSFTLRIVEQAVGLDLHIVSFSESEVAADTVGKESS